MGGGGSSSLGSEVSSENCLFYGRDGGLSVGSSVLLCCSQGALAQLMGIGMRQLRLNLHVWHQDQSREFLSVAE